MTIHASTAPEYALSPEPETPTPSIILPVSGTLPKSTSIRALRSAIAEFDGTRLDAFRSTYRLYHATFGAVLDDAEEGARKIVAKNDKSRIKNFGSYFSLGQDVKISASKLESAVRRDPRSRHGSASWGGCAGSERRRRRSVGVLQHLQRAGLGAPANWANRRKDGRHADAVRPLRFRLRSRRR